MKKSLEADSIVRHLPTAIVVGAILSLGLTRLGAQGSAPAYQFKAIAYLGDAAPGGGAFGSDFEPTALNLFGQLAFTAEPDLDGDEGVFLASPGGAIQQIMRFDQPAPGGLFFSDFELGQLGINLFGDVALAFTLGTAPGSAPNFGPPILGGVYRWSHLTQTLSPVVVPNVTPVTGTPGDVFQGAGFVVSLNNFGAIAFTGYVNGLGAALPNSGVFVQDRSGHIHTVARPGDPAPDGGTFVEAGTYASINDFGDVAFAGQTSLDSAQTFRVFVRWAGTGQIQAIPQPAGIVVTANVNINDRREITFGGGFFPFPNGLGLGNIYRWKDGQTTLVTGVGGPAPGGVIFTNIPAANTGNQLSFNNRGDIFFDAATDTGDEAVYLSSGATGTLRRLAGIGTVIPGVGTIVSLEQFTTLLYPPVPPTGVPLSNAALNDLGQVAFAATVVNGTTVRGVMLLGTPQQVEDDNAQGDQDE
jgi:hypothetical protein